MKFIQIFDGASIPAILVGKDGMASAAEVPDARIALIDSSGTAIAHAALWWRATPLYQGKEVGTIGGFLASTEEDAGSLLDGAAAHLRNVGCELAVGPMNGNTWRGHRFVIESDGRGPFLLEPRNAASDPEAWQLAGFSQLSHYSSSVIVLDGTAMISDAVKARLLRSGVNVRSLDAARFDDELRLIHRVSVRSFANNFLYTPLDEERFMEGYRKVRAQVDPDFILIAERNGSPCGFAFGIPDLEAASRGEKPALIVKTLAVDPKARCAGMGSLLVDELHQAAIKKGYTEAIHALQHESNISLKITGRHQGRVFRRYALFSKNL
jgi:GNAT superfamily N-acetyltransferase